MTSHPPATMPHDPALFADFQALCRFGGRLTGTAGEIAARDWAAGRLDAIAPGRLRREATPYLGWRCLQHELRLGDRVLDSLPLLCSAGTPAGGLDLEVVDCGRGTPADIEAAGSRVAGRAVLAQHEYMFATDTVHRRVKLNAAIEANAAAFLIAAPEAGMGAVTGSGVAREGLQPIPGLGISAEAAALIRTGTNPHLHIRMETEWQPDARTETLILDLPGGGPDRVVLSAHIDGHAPGESALDNATGVALALALARAAAPWLHAMPRGLTVCLFSAEEWALTGSKAWLAGLPAEDRQRLVFNLNLDTVTGGSRLTALTSGFPALGGFVTRAAGPDLGVHLPLMTNSDHANFAALGIPALRLVSGFNEHASPIRLLLSREDRASLAAAEDFAAPARMAWAILLAALTAPAAELAALRAG